MSIKIKKIRNNLVEIVKNEDLEYIVGISYGIHHKMLHAYNNIQLLNNKEQYKNSEMFNDILCKLTDFDSEFAIISEKELLLLSKWFESLSLILFEEFDENDEVNIIDISNENLKKYWKISHKFIEKSKKINEKKLSSDF